MRIRTGKPSFFWAAGIYLRAGREFLVLVLLIFSSRGMFFAVVNTTVQEGTRLRAHGPCSFVRLEQDILEPK